jgi:hypothetical protein
MENENKMIIVDGYKAFRGTMRISPKNPAVPPYEKTCDWLYKPDSGCWYGGGRSFPAQVCEVVSIA